MPIPLTIQDAMGSSRSARVGHQHALEVAQAVPDVPDIGTPNRYRLFSQKVSNDAGVTNMAVDGSVTTQSFYIAASPDYDILVRNIVFIVADGSIANNKFGAVAALLNGVQVGLEEAGEITYIIESAKTTGELLTETGVTYSYTDLANYNAANDNARVINLNITDEVASGIRIGRGTEDRFFVHIRDDLTLLTDFFVRCLGTRHYPVSGY